MVTLRYDRIDELIGDEKSGRVKTIADLAEVSPDYLWKIRMGKAPNVSAVVLGRVAEALGVSVDYLLGAERDEQGLPVSEPDFASVVARLNGLRDGERARLRIIIEAILEFGGYSPRSVDVRTQHRETRDILDLLAALPDEVYQSVVEEAERRRTGKSPGVPGEQSA
jgi:transcriptional regulator with XRE-family HTH domain